MYTLNTAYGIRHTAYGIRHTASRKYDFALSFLITTTLFIYSHTRFTILFETNDDVFFSMLAHGYGISAYQTTFLPASNFLIAIISQSIPTILGTPGYIALTICLSLISLSAIFYSLLRINTPYIILIPALILISSRPLFYPQFTVTAGMLTIAAIVSLYAYTKDKNPFYIPAIIFFATFGYLLRDQMFMLLGTISIPLLPWKSIFHDKKLYAAGAITVTVLCLSALGDHEKKNSPEIQKFTTFHYAMIPIFNYGAAAHLAAREDIYTKYGYTKNDIQALAPLFYFYETPKYTDASAIGAMLEEVGATYRQHGAFEKGIESVKYFFHAEVLPLILFSIILIVILPLSRKQRMIFVSTCLFSIAIFFFIGALGRPGRMRIYYPVAAFLSLAPIIVLQWQNISRRRFALTFIGSIFCLILSGLYINKIIQTNELMYKQVNQDLLNLPIGEPVFDWGGAFPYEAAYPVFGNYANMTKYNIPLFGGYTSAPFSTTTTLANAGKGFIDTMQKPGGVMTIVMDTNIERWENFIRIFAQEHLSCDIRLESEGAFRPRGQLFRVWCERNKP